MSEATMKRCPYCAEEIRADAIKCRYCLSRLDAPRAVGAPSEWYRISEGRKIAGVCTGLAKVLGIPVTLIRLAFLLATLIGGWGGVIYLALWCLMPPAPTESAEASAPSSLSASGPHGRMPFKRSEEGDGGGADEERVR